MSKTDRAADPQEHPGKKSFLDPHGLAERWGVSRQNLANMRHRGVGPVFTKLGGNVRYALDDVEAYEASQRFARTDQPA
ncbi:helix-turn-helix transcriptional regulator [Zafaria sp. Z1313]|uniref:helix-turn-helix transcriptional regulator n=1 Tax=Zafaria sp. Z1313 TaxID=3423202 RepID=UPI003D303896